MTARVSLWTGSPPTRSPFCLYICHLDHVQEYLDSLVGREDLHYLGEAEVARTIVELGYRFVLFKYTLFLSDGRPLFKVLCVIQ